MKHIICLLIAVLLFCLALAPIGAHPGRTDESGGHIDNSTGQYHFHHGYSAHQHPNGICPYRNSSSNSYSEDELGDGVNVVFVVIAVTLGACAVVGGSYWLYKRKGKKGEHDG